MSVTMSRPAASAASIGCARRAVAMAEHGRVLEQLAVGDHAIERRLVDEVVIACRRSRSAARGRVVTETDSDSVGSRSSRRRVIVVLPAPEGEDSTSRKPRRRIAVAGAARRAHSRFCTCSRNCSIAALSARPMRVSSISADFEHSVLASRLSSWHRKSSWRPTASPFAKQLAGLRDMGAQPVELLADVAARHQQRQLLRDPLLRHRRRQIVERGQRLLAAARAAPRAAPRRKPKPRRRARRARRAAPTAPRRAARLPRRAPRPAGRAPTPHAASSAARRASTTSSGSSSTVSMTPRRPISPSSRGGAASTSRGQLADQGQHLRSASRD